MRKIAIKVLIYLFSSILFSGCVALTQTADKNEKLTVDNSDKIKIGMSSREVAGLLGNTTNILQDKNGYAVMIYDRIQATTAQLDSSDQDTLILSGLVSNEDEPQYKQKTFTIIIRLDRYSLVRDFKFYPSMF